MSEMTQEAEQRAGDAREMWRKSVQGGKPITGAELGRAFGMSERWGQQMVAAAKMEDTQEIQKIAAEPAQPQPQPTANPQWAPQDEDGAAPAGVAFAPIPAPRTRPQTGEAHSEPQGEDDGFVANGYALPSVPEANGHPVAEGETSPLTSSLRVVSTSSEPVAYPQAPQPQGPRHGANGYPQGPQFGAKPQPQPTANPHPQPQPEALREPHTNPQDMPKPIEVKEPSKRERRFLIVLTLLVLLPGLGISAWSFYGYGREATAPMMLAMSASIAIDGIGLFAAFFAARFTNRGQSARFPRLVTYAMIVGSVYINWEHASARQWSTGLHVFVSAPAVAAAFAFEILMLELRVKERARHGQRHRARQAAKVEADMWVHHPFVVWKARRWENRDRINELFPGFANRKK